MNPNLDQVLSIIRWLLSVGGPVGAYLVSRKIPADQVSALQTAVVTVIGALPPIASFIWGLVAHTDTAKLKSVEAMPNVAKIVAKPGATDGVAAALADPARPKVTAQ